MGSSKAHFPFCSRSHPPPVSSSYAYLLDLSHQIRSFLKVFLMHHLLFLPRSLKNKSPLGYLMSLTLPLKLPLSRSPMSSSSPTHGEWIRILPDLSKALDRPDGIAQLVEYLSRMKRALGPILNCDGCILITPTHRRPSRGS